MSIHCEHGGLYEDPVTGKSREFDIRAFKTIANYRMRLAIECKNIRENFPVLVSCMPRHEKESYHQIALVNKPSSNGSFIPPGRLRAINIRNEHSIYKINEPVGKNTAQVGRTLDGAITANDGELYDKWSQALSSSVDLVSRIYWDADEEDLHLSAIIPIIVVPNERLWFVSYDDDGNRVHEPRLSDRCSCFVGKDYTLGTDLISTQIWISHIEIMTFTGLKSFVDSHITTKEGMTQLFSKEGISQAIALDKGHDRNLILELRRLFRED